MKKFGLLFASALALLALAACNEKEEPDNNQKATSDESYYASQATVTSSDSNFTANDSGGEIHFKAEGGSVTLNVNCGCEWLAGNAAEDLFSTTMTNTTLVITAGQNTVEKDLTGTVTLRTSNQRIIFATISITQTAYGAPEISVDTNEWNIPAVSAQPLTTEIGVTATADWTAEAADGWLTVTKTGSGITLTATDNGDASARSTKVTLTCTDGVRTEYEYVTVNQTGRAYISLSRESIGFSNDEDSASVTVESNYDWEYTYDSSNGWFTIARDGDTLTATVTANEAEGNREGAVTLTAGDGAENVTEVRLSVMQAGTSAMILTYTITSANTSTRLPLYGSVNCTVYWGDGSVQTVTSTQPSHTYASAGEYDVIISGTVTALCSNGIATESDPLPITAVKQWGMTGLTSMNGAFYYCGKLSSIPEYSGDAFADVTDFYCAFGCTALEKIPAGIFDNCSGVTTFGYVFYGCNSLKTIPTGLFSGCPKVTNFRNAFYGCSSLAEIPAGLFDSCVEATEFRSVFRDCSSISVIPKGIFDKCTKATTFQGAFQGCTRLAEIPSRLFANCPEVTSFQTVFADCTSLKTIPEDGIFNSGTKVTTFQTAFNGCSSLVDVPAGLFENCPMVDSFQQTFYNCKSLKSVPSGLFDNCTAVTTFFCLFYNCSSIEEIPAGLFANCPEVTTYAYAFYECSSLKAVPSGGIFGNATKVTTFYAVFYNCTSIAEIPEGLFDNCNAVTDFSFVFNNCSSLKSVPAGLFDDCPEVTSFRQAFYKCSSLTSFPSDLFSKNLKVTDFTCAFFMDTAMTGESPYDLIDGAKVHLYERANYPDIYTTPTSTSNCFAGCTGLTDFDSIPFSWASYERDSNE